MNFTNKNKAIIALIIANIVWGATSPILKFALSNFPPFSMAFLRFFGAMLIVFPFAAGNLFVAKKDWLNLVLLSIFGITINITFFFLGLLRSPSINAPIIASSAPIFIYLFSIIFLHEKQHRKILIGLFISLIGVLAIVGQPIIENGFDSNFIGNLFFILATSGAIGHAIFSKEILDRYSAVTITFWSFFISSFTFLPLFIYEMVSLNPFSTIDYRGWIGLVYGIVFASTIAYFLFEWGIKQVHAQEVGLFTYIDPVIAIIIAVPLLGEKITPVFIIGSLLIFTGIFFAERRIHYHPIHKLKK